MMGCNEQRTSIGLEKETEMERISDETPFKELAGALQYLVASTRPDIDYALWVAIRTGNPTKYRWQILVIRQFRDQEPK